MKTSELKRILRKRGCCLQKHGSRHDRWVNPENGKTTMLPRHDSQEIATGTVNSIMDALFG